MKCPIWETARKNCEHTSSVQVILGGKFHKIGSEIWAPLRRCLRRRGAHMPRVGRDPLACHHKLCGVYERLLWTFTWPYVVIDNSIFSWYLYYMLTFALDHLNHFQSWLYNWKYWHFFLRPKTCKQSFLSAPYITLPPPLLEINMSGGSVRVSRLWLSHSNSAKLSNDCSRQHNARSKVKALVLTFRF